MRLPLLLILLPLLALSADFYIFRRYFRHKSKWIKILWWGLSLVTLLLVCIGVTGLFAFPGKLDINISMWIFYIFFLVYMPKWFYSIFSLFDYVPRLWKRKKGKWGHMIGTALALYVIGSMLYGAFYARQHPIYNYRTISFPNLPEDFDGYRIVQFSDLHLETLGSAANYLPRWINRINQLHPDLIVFTGDLVNRRGNELPPYMNVLSRLSAPDGVYSILGNHDYGDYFHWGNPEEKEQTLRLLIVDEEKMGWTMLNNRSVFLRRGNDSIALIGVENEGEPPFSQYADLPKAMQGTEGMFQILLSHNPTHWRREVLPESDIDLMLAGHTHAMQLKLGNYSPSSYIYPEWSGMYLEGTRGLYVNVGIGYVGLPFRFGAWPEITVLTLRR